MEEKERYTIESFEIEESPVIFDNKIQQIILTLVDYNYDEITHLKDLLNHYFKRIKELEGENKQLKQQLHDLPKNIVGEIREKVFGLWYFVLEEQKEYFEGNRYVLSQKDFNEILNTILTKKERWRE